MWFLSFAHCTKTIAPKQLKIHIKGEVWHHLNTISFQNQLDIRILSKLWLKIWLYAYCTNNIYKLTKINAAAFLNPDTFWSTHLQSLGGDELWIIIYPGAQLQYTLTYQKYSYTPNFSKQIIVNEYIYWVNSISYCKQLTTIWLLIRFLHIRITHFRNFQPDCSS